MTESIQSGFIALAAQLSTFVLGRKQLIEDLLTAVLADGHVLLEGPPGLAKTRAAFLLANAFDASFKRVQFTPDLLPADLTGTTVYDARDHRFDFHPGPLFSSFILADEVNRAPAKVQAALLEAMEERQISVGGQTRPLPDQFFVVATQNPIEEEGTYELPAAQLDRFLMRLDIDYPDDETERLILDTVQRERLHGQRRLSADAVTNRLSVQQLQQARQQVLNVHLSAVIKDYIVRLITATRGRDPELADLSAHIAHPASPRGTLALARVCQARAWLHQRDYVTPQDVQQLVPATMLHRIRLSHRAEAQGVETSELLDELLARVVVA